MKHSFLLGGTNDNENIYIQKGQTERVAGFVFLNPFKLGLLYLSHPSLFRIYSYQKNNNTRWVSSLDFYPTCEGGLLLPVYHMGENTFRFMIVFPSNSKC